MNNFETNIEEVYEKFLELNAKEMNKAIKSALVAGAKELQKQTISNLDNSILVKGNSMNDLHEGVRIGKVRGEYGEDLEVKVNIMGKNFGRGSDGRLRWIETGTVNRQNLTKGGSSLNKPRNTGHMTGKYFFKSANEMVLSIIEAIYAQAMDQTIEKINNTKI